MDTLLIQLADYGMKLMEQDAQLVNGREYLQRGLAFTGKIERNEIFVRRLDATVHLSYTRKCDLCLFPAMTSLTNANGAILALLMRSWDPKRLRIAAQPF